MKNYVFHAMQNKEFNSKDLIFFFIKDLLKERNDILSFEKFTLELVFADNLRRADFVGLSAKDNRLIGIEIKSDRDNISRLEEQLNDYNKAFDYTYVLTTNKHLNNILKIDGKFGILLYDSDEKLIVKRKSQKNKLNKSYLKYIVGNGNKQHDKNITNLKKQAIESLEKKISYRYNSFISEFKMNESIDDLYLLYKNSGLKYYLGF